MADKRKYRVFKLERRDINFPMWRKKVDASIFKDKAIHIPKFAVTWWNIHSQFSKVTNRNDVKSKIKIRFNNECFEGSITDLKAQDRTDTFRIFYGNDLADQLKKVFVMSFMRDLEFKLGDYATEVSRESIEDIIPFNEFLDIEYSNKKRTLYFTAHYTQRPTFPNLFAKIIDSTILKSIDLQLSGREDLKIHKMKWLSKDELAKHVDAKNVIYYLFDEVKKEIYIGEAKSLKERLSATRTEIPGWTHFRYDVLPPPLEPFRLEIERMLIQSFAYLFPSEWQKGDSKHVSDHILKNKKIL